TARRAGETSRNTRAPCQIAARNARGRGRLRCGILARPRRRRYRWAMATNQIREVTFRPGPGADGGPAPFMAPGMRQPGSLPFFLEDVVTRFKRARASGPPDARAMLITIVGDVSAAEFALAWQASVAEDAPARALLGMLHQADVMQGDAQGRMLGQASLL